MINFTFQQVIKYLNGDEYPFLMKISRGKKLYTPIHTLYFSCLFLCFKLKLSPYLHQYLEEDHQQKLFEKSVLFVLHSDEPSNMWENLEPQLDHYVRHQAGHHLSERGKNDLKYKNKYNLNLRYKEMTKSSIKVGMTNS